MKLKIYYDPETDTLDIGNGRPGNDGQPVAERLVAFFDENDEVVSITLENASEVLAPFLKERIAEQYPNIATSILRDEGQTL
ncbi:MAG: DUF2283 domain-containing protein [Chloroflexi bacterium]|nr:DUF2283 domain-containing protein [Chloroflexota bacterium]MYK62155.1 DUF2283 domain-containing protein [Chloroflexota bacterium]